MADTKPYNAFQKRQIQLQQARETRAEVQLEHDLGKFAMDEIGERVMTALANTPFDRWPEVAQIAFSFAKDRIPVLAHFYKERLPK